MSSTLFSSCVQIHDEEKALASSGCLAKSAGKSASAVARACCNVESVTSGTLSVSPSAIALNK